MPFAVVAFAIATHLVCTVSARAQDPNAGTPPPQGLKPVPNYDLDLASRAYLSGDWGGVRSDLADKGIQLTVDWNQYLQGVVDGGLDRTTRYGGTLDYVLDLDLMRMGVLDGALISIRAESRYGHSVNGQAGSILPVNTDAFFPLTDGLDDEVALTITDLKYMQFLSPSLALLLGKADTLSGDPNEFASGRGTTQFMNANFMFNAVTALRMPYSTLAAGAIWLPVQDNDRAVSVSGLMFNTTDSSTTSGFDDFGDGTTAIIEADFQYRLGRLPGGMNVGGLYSFDQDFAQVGGQLIFQPGQGISLSSESDTWAIYCSGWQYLTVEEDVDAPIDLANGVADRQGIGLFARLGFADQDTNPLEWSISGGVGGRGILPGRDNDTFGVGYYYSAVQDSRLTGILDIEDHVQGFEAFYNIALTPAARVTLDAQIVESLSSGVDTAFIFGMRVGLTF